jgi:hypothetical protein
MFLKTNCHARIASISAVIGPTTQEIPQLISIESFHLKEMLYINFAIFFSMRIEVRCRRVMLSMRYIRSDIF